MSPGNETSHHCAMIVTGLASDVWALSNACNDPVKLREIAREWEMIEAAHVQLGRVMDRILKNPRPVQLVAAE